MVRGKRAQNQQEPNIFEDNPFLQGFLEWMVSPRGQLSNEVREVVWEMLDDIDVDAKRRVLIWDDGQCLSIAESVARISQSYTDYPTDLIETHLIAWLEMNYIPPAYTPQQLDELDVLTDAWVTEHYKQQRDC